MPLEIYQRFPYPKTKALTISALFATILSISSIVSIPIPITQVPITLQVFIVFLIAMILGPTYGFLSCAIYLLIGASGLPVFAGATSGMSILLGPTGGYLFGFPLAAFLGGLSCRNKACSRRSDAARLIVSAIISISVIYLLGVLWLSTYLHSLYSAVIFGAIPFIPVDAIKAAIAIPVALQIRWSRLALPITVNAGLKRDSTGELKGQIYYRFWNRIRTFR